MRNSERGTALVLFTFITALVVIPMVGLAIDGSIVFWAKAKLSAAVDAAALTAGRSINVKVSNTQNTCQTSGPVVTVAQQWFAANYPNGWLGTQVLNGGPQVCYNTTPDQRQQVTISATASVPLYFARLAGFPSMNVSAMAQSSRRNSFIILVLDRSGSMNNNAGGNACTVMQQDATNFVNLFTENFDTLGLVTYSSTAGPAPDFVPSTTFKSGMASTIGNITCVGATSMAQGLQIAYQTIQNYGLAGGLNAIVLFTDGQPNEVVADFPIRTQPDTRYGFYPPGYGYQDYNTQYSVQASTCQVGGTILGGLTVLTNPLPFKPQGMTGGLFDTTDQVPVSTSASILNSAGCFFTNDPQTGMYVRYDVASIPSKDHWKNRTDAGYAGNSAYYGPGVSAPDRFPSGPNATGIRPDEQTIGVMAAAINAADYQAQAIRADTTYNPVIYTIGLGGAPDLPIDSTLLQRIANVNVPANTAYNGSEQSGLFAYASDPTQLNQAFVQVAGQILRLTK